MRGALLLLAGSLLQASLPVSGAQASDDSLLWRYPSRNETPGQTIVYRDQLPELRSESSSAFGLGVGVRTLRGLQLRNEPYQFKYPQDASLLALSAGWERPIAGGFSTRFELGYGTFSDQLGQSAATVRIRQQEVRLHLLPISAGLLYQADLAPWMRYATPTVAAGAGYHLFFQSGDVDGMQVRGGRALYEVSLGLRHSLSWLGLSASSLAAEYRLLRPFSTDAGAFDLGGSLIQAVVVTAL